MTTRDYLWVGFGAKVCPTLSRRAAIPPRMRCSRTLRARIRSGCCPRVLAGVCAASRSTPTGRRRSARWIRLDTIHRIHRLVHSITDNHDGTHVHSVPNANRDPRALDCVARKPDLNLACPPRPGCATWAGGGDRRQDRRPPHRRRRLLDLGLGRGLRRNREPGARPAPDAGVEPKAVDRGRGASHPPARLHVPHAIADDRHPAQRRACRATCT